MTSLPNPVLGFPQEPLVIKKGKIVFVSGKILQSSMFIQSTNCRLIARVTEQFESTLLTWLAQLLYV